MFSTKPFTNFLQLALFACISSGLYAAERGALDGLIESHCASCHAKQEPSGGLDLGALALPAKQPNAEATWIKIFDKVEQRAMPPDDPLPENIRREFLHQISGAISPAIKQRQREHGRTTLRRLNRREFENTLHDLFGIKVPLKHLLPEDGNSGGFDTVSNGLRISAVQIERYLEAIDVALDDAFRLTEKPTTIAKRYLLKDEKEIRDNLDKPENELDPISGNKHKHLFHELENAIVYISHGYSPDNIRQFTPPADGLYRVRVSAYGLNNETTPVTLRMFVSDWKQHRLVGYFDMPCNQPRILERTIPLTTRDHLRVNGHGVGIDANGKSVWNVETVKDWKVPGLAVEWIEVEGPLLEAWPPEPLVELVGKDHVRPLSQRGKWTPQGHIAYEIKSENPEHAVRDIVERFAPRVFRRPVPTSELESYIQIGLKQLANQASLEQAIRVSIRSMLVSPRFLFLDEAPGPLDDYALAARLSYFLWSAPPDETLIQLAAASKLSNPKVLREQAERMLHSPKSNVFLSSFAAQWLDLAQIDATTPDMRLYPEYDEMLRTSMLQETEAFLRTMLDQNLPLSNLIDSDFLMLDQRMADHYSIELDQGSENHQVFGEQFRRVKKPADSLRGGLLTQASILKVTANGTVTSPVLRGAWILRHVLGTPPAPPPPVPAIEPDTRGAQTIREQLAKHRDVDTCNRCHSVIDPPGFALESFDVIGGYREQYRSIGKGDPPKTKLFGRDVWEYRLGLPVDCSGETADGYRFQDVREFKQWLLKHDAQIMRHLTNQLIAYGTGATVSFVDRDHVNPIVDRMKREQGGLKSLILEVVTSEMFRSK